MKSSKTEDLFQVFRLRLSKNDASCAENRVAGVHEGVKTRLVIQ